MASAPNPSGSIEEPPSELTVNLISPPQPVHRFHHLKAFLANLAEPILLENCAMACVVNSIVTLTAHFFGFYLEDPNHPVTLPNIALASVLFLTIPVYVYEALILPRDHSITLSLSTQQMHVTRLGLVHPSLTVPLNQILNFSSTNCPPHQSKLGLMQRPYGNYIIANTTGGPLKLGASKASYDTAVTHLNQFLLHHRANHATKTPYAPLSPHNLETFRATPVDRDESLLPALSHLFFQETGSNEFKCVRRSKLPMHLILTGTNRVYMKRFITLAEFFERIHSHTIFLLLLFAFYTGLVFCFARLTPAQWIFSEEETWGSRLRRVWNRLRGAHFVPLGMYRRIEIEGRSCSTEKDIRSTVVQEKVAPTMLYSMRFISDNGESEMIDGFSEGEAVCLIGWLQRRFPHLFKSEGSEDEAESDGDGEAEAGGDGKSLDEKKRQ